MKANAVLDRPNASTLALDGIFSFVQSTTVGGKDDDFGKWEEELHERVMRFERELIGEKLREADIDAKEGVLIDGKVHRKVGRDDVTILTAAGPVKVKRSLYKDRRAPKSRSMGALERRVGIVEGMTPRAAKLAQFVVTECVPEKAAELFARMGNMSPSKSTLDRLPKALSEVWETDREVYEATLREVTVIPEGTTTLAVSLDGVLIPTEAGKEAAKRSDAVSRGRNPSGPLGYQEATCASLSFCDEEGKMLGAIRFARAPESGKVTLKSMLTAETEALLARYPELRIVKLADGAKDNWVYLSEKVPEGTEVLDFFHASEKLSAALSTAYGEGTRKAKLRYEELKLILRDDDGGVESVIRSLAYLAKKRPKRKAIKDALGYFRNNRNRMRYAEYRAEGLPIGSGVVEATCKTLVAQRLKRSGMYWATDGAQAILTPRGWTQSERFDEAWALLAATYRSEVALLTPVSSQGPAHVDEENEGGAEVIPFPRLQSSAPDRVGRWGKRGPKTSA